MDGWMDLPVTKIHIVVLRFDPDNCASNGILAFVFPGDLILGHAMISLTISYGILLHSLGNVIGYFII